MTPHFEPNFQRETRRLFRLRIYLRWLFVLCCWLTLFPLSLWGLRKEIDLLREHFTWVAVRYGLAYNLFPAFCLFFCIGITLASLVWQIRYSSSGISPKEQQRLENQVRNIRRTGSRHPLWKWVFKK